MFFVSKIVDGGFEVTDTEDMVEEFYTDDWASRFPRNIVIEGIRNGKVVKSYSFSEFTKYVCMRRKLAGEKPEVDIKGLVYHNDSVINYATERDTIIVPEGTKAVGKEAFSENLTLREIALPHGLERIGAGAFMGCANLRRVILPSSLSSIEPLTFGHCRSLEGVDIPDGVRIIKDNAFNLCRNLPFIALPDSVTELEESAFSMCLSLVKVRLSENLLKIPKFCFYKCNHLENVIVPSSVKQIGNGAFYDCNRMNTITILSKDIKISGSAFKSNASNHLGNIPDLKIFCYEDNTYVREYAEDKHIQCCILGRDYGG